MKNGLSLLLHFLIAWVVLFFVGVNDDGVAVGLNKKEIDNTKILVLRTINRYIFPHVEVEFEIFKIDELL